jgi:hypothetical protein
MVVTPVEDIENVGGQLELSIASQTESLPDLQAQGLDRRGLDLTVGAILAHETVDGCERIGGPEPIFQSNT